MAAYQGTAYTIPFTFRSTVDQTPIDITGWTFESDIRDNRDDEPELLNLTNANGGFVITDAAFGRVEMRLTAAQTAALNVGKYVFDILRTDVDPGPVYILGGTFKVKKPVTR